MVRLNRPEVSSTLSQRGTGPGGCNMSSKKLILNVDTGVDDAVAIMLAAAAETRETRSGQHQLLAILCTVGNVSVEQVYTNTLRVLQVCQRTDIPVYKGAACSLLGQKPNSDPAHIHGEDGLGGICCSVAEFSLRPNDATRNRTGIPKHAAVALVDLVNKYQGEIKLVSTAPLTNLALALRLDPSLGDKLAELVLMGGNIQGRGRVIPCAEFNFHCDPEAARVCLTELTCPVTIIPYEVCLRSELPWEWVDELIKTRTTKTAFLRDSLSRAIHILKDVKKLPGLYLCDPLAAAYALDTLIALEVVPKLCTVELHGEYTRGQMVVDWAGTTGNLSNVKIVHVINVSVFQEMLMTMAKS